jgi:hypothetical protein
MLCIMSPLHSYLILGHNSNKSRVIPTFWVGNDLDCRELVDIEECFCTILFLTEEVFGRGRKTASFRGEDSRY